MINQNKFIPIANPSIGEEEAKAVYDVIKSGWITMGKKVEQFENMICDYTGSKYAIAMNNGTSTLQSLLSILEIGPGDEVIVPSLNYISAANVVLYQGAKLVLCDNNIETYNVEADHIREKITQNTKAFITVDMKGLPVNFEAFSNLSEETGIPFISDSAESYGALYKGNKVGTQALAHSFSFFANKNITTGEGGAITTNNYEIYKKLKILRNQGQEGRYNHTVLGNNFRMPDILAAFGIEQLKKIDDILNKKMEISDFYKKSLSNVPNISTPYIPDYVTRPSWYMYSIRTKNVIRDILNEHLNNHNIDTRLSFPPIHIQPYYKKRFLYENKDYPNAIESFNTFLDIPIWADMGKDNLNFIVNQIKECIFNNDI